MLLARATTPNANRLSPLDCSGQTIAITPCDVYREAVSMARDHCSRIGETLDRLDEIVAVPRGRRVEVEGSGMAQVALCKQVGQD
jgi:hypothetical protein